VKFNKDYHENFQNLTQKPINYISQLIPYPSYIKTPASIVVNIILSKFIDTITENFLPGAHFLVNIIYELFEENIDFSVLDDNSFNFKIIDGKDNYSFEADYQKCSSEQIDLRAICKYKTQTIDDTKKKLKPRLPNIDWYLYNLKTFDWEKKINDLIKREFDELIFKDLEEIFYVINDSNASLLKKNQGIINFIEKMHKNILTDPGQLELVIQAITAEMIKICENHEKCCEILNLIPSLKHISRKRLDSKIALTNVFQRLIQQIC
jgi:hypothetical protein